MSKKSLIIVAAGAIVLALSLVALAQNQQDNRGFGSQGYVTHPNMDPANRVLLEGIVEGVNIGRGQGFPSFTLAQSDGRKATVVASPLWVLLDANFKIALGDNMSVLAYPPLQYKDTYVAAELKNLTNGAIIILRDSNGVPVGGRGGRGMCAACPCGNIGNF